MQNGMNSTGVTKRKSVRNLMLVFTGMMVLLTFFSNTINNITAPKVLCVRPESGQLVKEFSGEGEVRADKILEQTIPVRMKVLTVAVKAGEAVKKGQTLMTLDTSELEDQIRDETDIGRQKELRVEQLREELSEASLKEYDRTVDSAFEKLENLRNKLKKVEMLFEAGAVAAVDVENAKNEAADAERGFEAAKAGREKGINNSKRNLENAQSELEMQERKVDRLKGQLEFRTVTALADGIILELKFAEGTFTDGTTPVYRLADAAAGFSFYADVDRDAAGYLAPGDTAELEISALGSGRLEAEISGIRELEEQRGTKKTIVINIDSDIAAEGLAGGEKGFFELRKSIAECPVLVPNSAVGQDSSGYFVYVVGERKGPLGNEYYARKVKISTGGSDFMNTAVLSGISSYDRVISGSDKPFSDGMRIIVNQE